QHLAHLARHIPRERFLVVPQQLADAEEDFAPVRRGIEPPQREGALRGLYRPPNFGLAALRERPDKVAAPGIAVLHRLPPRGLDPPAVDIVLVQVGHDSCSRAHNQVAPSPLVRVFVLCAGIECQRAWRSGNDWYAASAPIQTSSSA